MPGTSTNGCWANMRATMMLILLLKVVLFFELTIGYTMDLQRTNMVEKLCGSGEDERPGCRTKLRLLVGMTSAADTSSADSGDVMTSPMVRILPCTIAKCASAIDSRSDLFECIRAKCIYQTYTQVPSAAGSLKEIENVLESVLEKSNPGETAKIYGTALDFFRRSQMACYGHCRSITITGDTEKVSRCMDKCVESLRHPGDLRKLLHEKDNISKVNKRWSSRLCMEAHCKRFEVNGGQWFRCGQNHCGR